MKEVSADLGIDGIIWITDLSGKEINANKIPANSEVFVNFNFTNFEQNIYVPEKTFQIVVQLGEGFEPLQLDKIDPNFTFGISDEDKHQIEGLCTKGIPADYTNILKVPVKAVKQIKSAEILAQLVFINMNDDIEFNDPNSANDFSMLEYTIV